jgi:hypothetical protein
VKRLGIIVALLIVLLIGGGLTTQLISSGESGPLPVLRTTANPEASVSEMVPWKAEQLFLIIGFILFNLIGMAVTIALVVWLIDRAIRKGRAEAAASGGAVAKPSPTAPETAEQT